MVTREGMVGNFSLERATKGRRNQWAIIISVLLLYFNHVLPTRLNYYFRCTV
jgi:hypothetical protein